jgi:superfamily II RNA helicase
MTTYMIKPDLSKPVDPALYPATVPYTFPLDPFQQHAISAIHQGHNTAVFAKTGSGKTLVGDYQVRHCLAKGQRIYYTTPIKSLSNQKYGDFKADYPEASVGLMTGDFQIQPDAQIVVMTTEIVRNLLYKRGTKTEGLGLSASLSLDGVGAVIFDECHYINDPDRGKVWEEVLVLLPPTVQIVLLSATLYKPELFVAWLGDLKKVPIHLLQTTYRVVPLTHVVLDDATDEFRTVLTPGTELFRDKIYRDWLTARRDLADAHRHFKERVHARNALGEVGATEGKVRPKTFSHRLNHTVGLLQHRGLLPALLFVFSRKGCEEHARKVSQTLLDSSEQAAVRHIVSFHLKPFQASLDALPQYHVLHDLLIKGIAFHHSGLLPILKETVELLFSKGFVKLLFATETFAVGLNMPTKTVVFTGLSKFDDGAKGMRLLRTDEYTQMAGRAGRRGKDTEGLVLYLPEREPVEVHELQQIMCGAHQTVQSRMDFHYDFLLKTLQTGACSWLGLMEQSYWFQQRQVQREVLTQDLTAVEAQETALRAATDAALLAACEERDALDAAFKVAPYHKKKDAQRALEQWKNKYKGPDVTQALTAYTQLKSLRIRSSELRTGIQILETHANRVAPQLAFLRSIGYLEAGATETLTLRGILATEVNEANPLLLTELFLSKRAHALEGPALASLLSVFLESYNKECSLAPNDLSVPKEIVTTMLSLDDDAYRLRSLEESMNAQTSETFWDLSLQWVEPIYRWITEESLPIATLCSEYGLFEGNFIRGLHKVANILDEWLSLATYCEHTDQIEKVAALKPRIVRGLAMPDSLYLKL